MVGPLIEPDAVSPTLALLNFAVLILRSRNLPLRSILFIQIDVQIDPAFRQRLIHDLIVPSMQRIADAL
jgi:hypothetical protein